MHSFLEKIAQVVADAIKDIIVKVIVQLFVVLVKHIREWVVERLSRLSSRRRAFTLRKALRNGSYTLYQGIFDTATSTVEDVRKINYQRMDEELREIHRSHDLAIYNG